LFVHARASPSIVSVRRTRRVTMIHQPQNSNELSFWLFLKGRYILTWVGLAFLWFVQCLPFRMQLYLGAIIGRLLYILATKRRHIASRNIDACFLSLGETEKKVLTQQTFIENTVGLFETARTFWGKIESLRNTVTFEGLDHLQAAVNQKKGVILVGAHYTNLDLGGALFSLFHPVDIVYRPHNNALFDLFLKRARARWADAIIPKNSIKSAIKSLRAGHVFWFPADQDYGPDSSVFAPFFGIDAATITTPSRLAKLTGAPVLVLGHHRKMDNSGYVISVSAPIEPFPTEDLVEDAARINSALAAEIRKAPAQYMWVHRRFKTRRMGEKGFYE
jgi:Kdo2-lipid IVA lauroyltransferase/acyltransferase